MKFVDEFRDPTAIARTAEEIRRIADPQPPLSPDGGVRRAHARHLSLRPKGFASRERRAGAWSGLPGVRASDGPH